MALVTAVLAGASRTESKQSAQCPKARRGIAPCATKSSSSGHGCRTMRTASAEGAVHERLENWHGFRSMAGSGARHRGRCLNGLLTLLRTATAVQTTGPSLALRANRVQMLLHACATVQPRTIRASSLEATAAVWQGQSMRAVRTSRSTLQQPTLRDLGHGKEAAAAATAAAPANKTAVVPVADNEDVVAAPMPVGAVWGILCSMKVPSLFALSKSLCLMARHGTVWYAVQILNFRAGCETTAVEGVANATQSMLETRVRCHLSHLRLL